jgi:hypothetical protein
MARYLDELAAPGHTLAAAQAELTTMNRLPNFLIIGAMKSATSTLYEQLLRQPGIFLPELKEPNFFSDDRQYARGLEWYQGLFNGATATDILGEASTHYTKLPTYPETLARIHKHLDRPRLIYVMRHPVDRLISQYIHQWSEHEIRCNLDKAVEQHPELTAYSFYTRQLAPFIEAYGKSSILPMFFDRIRKFPQQELERICKFIGYAGEPLWQRDLSPDNVSAERVRKFPLYDLLVESPIATALRQSLVPKGLRTKVRQFFSMTRRPELSADVRKDLEKSFDADLAILGEWLGVDLNCSNFAAVTSSKSLEWV